MFDSNASGGFSNNWAAQPEGTETGQSGSNAWGSGGHGHPHAYPGPGKNSLLLFLRLIRAVIFRSFRAAVPSLFFFLFCTMDLLHVKTIFSPCMKILSLYVYWLFYLDVVCSGLGSECLFSHRHVPFLMYTIKCLLNFNPVCSFFFFLKIFIRIRT